MAQLVEHNLAKVGVAGSSPVVRSIACIGPVFESALFISMAKWPSGKAEACKAFTPGSNPGFASRSPKGPSERRAPFRSRVPLQRTWARCGGAGAVRGADPGRRRLRRCAPPASSTAESAGAGGRCPAAADAGAVRAAPCESGRFSK